MGSLFLLTRMEQGDIVTCSISQLSIHTVNGHHIASIRLAASEPILSLALHERETSLVPILACGSTYGNITLRTWDADSNEGANTGEGKAKANWKIKTVRQLQLRRESLDEDWVPGVTALEFVG